MYTQELKVSIIKAKKSELLNERKGELQVSFYIIIVETISIYFEIRLLLINKILVYLNKDKDWVAERRGLANVTVTLNSFPCIERTCQII